MAYSFETYQEAEASLQPGEVITSWGPDNDGWLWVIISNTDTGGNTMKNEKVTWLSQYKHLVRETERLAGEIERWRSIAEKVTPSASLVPGGGSPDGTTLERAVEEIAELQEMLGQAVHKATGQRMRIEKVVQSLNEPIHQDVLRYRYIEGMAWKEVAGKVHYSKGTTLRYHSQAINILDTAT